MKILASVFATVFAAQLMAAAPIVQEGYKVLDSEMKELKTIKLNKDLVIDHIHPGSHYEVYGPKGLGKYLAQLGLEYRSVTTHEHNKVSAATYPSPEEIESQIQRLAQAHPEIIKLFSIGKSAQGRELWVAKISDNPNTDEREPEFKYIANMHGDEIVGRELMVRLIEKIANDYKSGDAQTVQLVENTEIFIMPSMNPDGANSRRRGNASWSDLNRDFPDFTTSDDQNTPSGRQPETKALMRFQAQRNFALSANFHGGAEVVNYPWDTSADDHPFEQLVIDLSLQYASQVDGMYDSRRFDRGITNGYDWYEVNGGMQDWSYHWHNDLQVTVELSNSKWPNYTLVQTYWERNTNALVDYLANIHQGVGFYFESALESGSVTVRRNGTSLGEYFFNHGEFYKVLPQGTYELSYKTRSGKEGTLNLTVSDNITPESSFVKL